MGNKFDNKAKFKYNPDWPGSIDDAIEILEDLREESDDEDNIAFRSGISVGLVLLRRIKKNGGA